MSSDPEQEYFSDGISEELLNLLAQIPDLKVIARTSSFSFKGKDVPIAEIAQTLDVAHVLEGSVRKSGNKLRITAQLICAADSTQLWSQTWDRPLDDVFAVQDEIAGAVVTQLKVELLGDVPKADVVDPKAYALWLQARQLGRMGNPEAWEQSLALSQQAVSIEPGFAQAWRTMATTYSNQGYRGLRPREEAYRLSREAAERALASDPDLAGAHSNLGFLALRYERDLAAAASHFRRALELDPSDPLIKGNASTVLGELGRLEEGIAILVSLVRSDPVNPQLQVNLGAAYLIAGRYDEAIASGRPALQLAPGYIGLHANIALALARKGDLEASLAEAGQEPNEAARLAALARIHESLGQPDEADAALAALREKSAPQTAETHVAVFSARNELDRAFEWLEKGVADRNVGPLLAHGVDPALDNLRKDPRWLPFLRQQGWAPDQLAAIEFEVPLPPQ